MKHFHAREFAAAKGLFEQAAEGPSLEIAHTARLHARMCAQRMAQAEPQPEGAEDLYHYAISQINRRRLTEAESALRRALEQAPGADHILYAMALVHGLRGNIEASADALSRAIQIDPNNRLIARKDTDFLEFGKQPPLRDLIFADATSNKKET